MGKGAKEERVLKKDFGDEMRKESGEVREKVCEVIWQSERKNESEGAGVEKTQNRVRNS